MTRILSVFKLLKRVGFAVLLLGTAYGQPPDTLWTRVIFQDRISVLTTGWLENSGQVVLAGLAADTIRPEGGPYDFALGTINTAGDLLSYHRYNDQSSGQLGQFGNSCPDTDGNVLLAGLGGLGIACLKINSTGDTIWSRSYFTLATSVRGVVCCDTSGFLICGARSGAGENLLDGYIMKISPNGDSLWHRQFSGGFGTSEEIWDVVSDRNGFVFSMSGETNNAQDPDTTFTDIIRIDSVGNIVERWQYRFTSYTIVRDISIGSGGHIYGAGYVRNQSFQGDRRLLFCVDNVGTVRWSKIGMEEQFSSDYIQVESAYDYGGCTVLGNVTYSLDGRALLESYSSDGDTNWTASYLPSFLDIGDNAVFTNMVKLEDGRYLLNGLCSKIIPESRYGTGLILTEADPLSSIEPFSPLPQSLYLSAFPNPFNPTTTLSFSLPQSSLVELSVYDALGRVIMTRGMGMLHAGAHEIAIDGAEWSSGVYFARVSAGRMEKVVKMALLR